MALLPPAVMLGLEWAAERIRGGWGWRLHLAFVAALVAGFTIQIAKDFADGPAALLIALALAAGRPRPRTADSGRSSKFMIVTSPLASFSCSLPMIADGSPWSACVD